MVCLLHTRDRQTIGKLAENVACDYLLAHGLHLLQKNYVCRLGEIDLIMKDHNILVFIEVRYRRTRLFGSGAESVDYSKQQKIIQVAEYYLLAHQLSAHVLNRFDVVSVGAIDSGCEPVCWIKNAFQVEI